MPAAIRLSLAAAPCVCLRGRWLPLQPLDAALLSWLALQGPTPRARLAELLWPGAGELGRASLRQRLFKLRQATGEQLVTGQQTLALAAGTETDLDGADTLLEGVALDGGDHEGMVQWLTQERERRRLQRRTRLEQALQGAESRGDLAAGLQAALDWVAAEPELEAAHAAVVRAHYLLGDRAAGLRAYERLLHMLGHVLGVAPQPSTQALRRLFDAPAAGGATATAVVPAALLRPPRLVGREAELLAAEQAWAQGKVVALVAEAGMGKTRLLQQLAAAPGSTLYAAARPGDAGVPLATLARLLRALPQQPGAALPAAQQRELARVLPGTPTAAAAGDTTGAAVPPAGQRLLLQQALTALLQAQSDRGLSHVLLDDLHFADGASLQLLQSLLDDAASTLPALRWALGCRPAPPGGALRALHDALAESAHLQAVALAPLAPATVEALLEDLALPGLAGAELAQALWQRTGGNPMYLLETLKQALSDGAPHPVAAAASARPQGVSQLIGRRLGQLSPTALALARCAAVAGTDFSAALASRVMQVPAIALADPWAELEAAGVLRDHAFAHDLVFEAVLDSVPKAIARQLHGEVAAFLQEQGQAAPATLARHWLAAALPQQAVGHLRAAAQAAAQACDVAEAARLWAQLAELQWQAGDGDTAFQTGLAAFDALRIHTTGSAADASLDRLQQMARSPAQCAEVFAQRANLCILRGDLQQAEAHARQGLAAAGGGAPGPVRRSLLNTLGMIGRRLGHLDAAAAALREAVALARNESGEGAAGELASYLNNLGLVLQEQDAHLDAIALMEEAAERQPDPATRARVLNNMAISLDEIGQAPLALERRLAAARAVAGSGLVEAMVAISLGANARALCRFREAMLHLDHAEAVTEGTPHNRGEDLLRQRAALWLELGRVNLAREALEQLRARHPRDHEEPYAMPVRARLAIALHQPAEAAALLQRAAGQLAGQQRGRQLRRVQLLQATLLPPAEARVLLEQALAAPAVQANAAAALPLTVRLAQVQLALGEPAGLALATAQRAADWLAAVHPLEMTPAEVWLTLAKAASAAGDAAAARAAVARGRAFVETVASEHLDEIYRDGWRRLNRVNAELEAWAARLA